MKQIKIIAALILICIFPVKSTLTAQGFTGNYAPGNWTTSCYSYGCYSDYNMNSSSMSISNVYYGGASFSYNCVVTDNSGANCPLYLTFTYMGSVGSGPAGGSYSINGNTYTLFSYLDGYGSHFGTVGPVAIQNGDVLSFNIGKSDFATVSLQITNFQIVQIDTIDPVPDVALLPSVNSLCNTTVTPPTATDNCAGTITGTTNDPLTFDSAGTYQINWIYTDSHGNSTSQMQNITITDTIAPASNLYDTTVTCNLNECSMVVNYTPSDTLFSQPYIPSSFSYMYNEGSLCAADNFPVPANEIWEINAISFAETVCGPVPDSILIKLYADSAGFPGATLHSFYINSFSVTNLLGLDTWGNPIYSIRLDLPYTVSLSGTPGGSIYWIATEGIGTDCYCWVSNGTTGYDNNMLFSWSSLNSMNWSAGSNNPQNQVFSLHKYIPFYSLFTDNECGITSINQIEGLPSGADFPAGTTINIFEAIDGAGNVTVDSFTVTVLEITPPVPEDIADTVFTECTTLTPPIAIDDCTGSITATSTSSTTFTTEGNYTVVWTYADIFGNSATQSQLIIVDDITSPVPSESELDEIIEMCNVSITNPPTAIDACSGNTIIATTNDPLFYDIPGIYTITWTYDDSNGNTTTQTQLAVVVEGCSGIEDNNGFANILLYPNPVHDQLYLKTTDQSMINYIEILDISGRTVSITPNNSSEIMLNIVDFDTGTYLVKVVVVNSTRIYKVIKY